MKAKFTKASQKDGTLVTINLKQFADDAELAVVGSLDNGDEIRIVIDGVPTLFYVNRCNKKGHALTAATRAFPRHLRLPTLARPTYGEVTEINYSARR